MFQHRHYEFLARFCGQMLARHYHCDTLYDEVIALANALETDNPRFQRVRFLKACGKECSSALGAIREGSTA